MTQVLEGCAECERGWRYADDAYLERRFPLVDDATVEQVAEVEAKRALYPDHVFPCDACRPEAFKAWASGCWSPGHVKASCDLCGPPKKDRR